MVHHWVGILFYKDYGDVSKGCRLMRLALCPSLINRQPVSCSQSIRKFKVEKKFGGIPYGLLGIYQFETCLPGIYSRNVIM